MKKYKLLILTIFITKLLIAQVVSQQAPAATVNIPDANFKTYLVDNTSINTNGDNEIQVSEANSYTDNISIASMDISDLTGIEAFIKVRRIYCNNNKISSLNLSSNTNLEVLYCYKNNLSSLDVSNSTNLRNLYCQNNVLGSLNLEGNPNLKYLKCGYNNLTSLNLKNNTSLESLNCSVNKPLTSLDLTQNLKLKTADCNNNSISNLLISPSLTRLSCFNNKLSSLDVSQAIQLKSFQCFQNNLTNLDISSNTQLTFLNCQNNKLTSLEVVNNKELTGLNFSYNNIQDVDVTQNTKLTRLYSSYNPLNSIDVTQNILLEKLSLTNLAISNLDVSRNSLLIQLQCRNNRNLTAIDLNNGNNSNMKISTQYESNFTNIPNLTDVCVDALNSSLTDYITSQTGHSVNYTTACNASLSVNKSTSLTFSAYPNPTKGILMLDTGLIDTHYSISDILGHVLKKDIVKTNTTIDISTFKNGIYYLSLTKDNNTLVKTIIKK